MELVSPAPDTGRFPAADSAPPAGPSDADRTHATVGKVFARSPANSDGLNAYGRPNMRSAVNSGL